MRNSLASRASKRSGGVKYGRGGEPLFAWASGGDSLDACKQLADRLLELACGKSGGVSGSGSVGTTTAK